MAKITHATVGEVFAMIELKAIANRFMSTPSADVGSSATGTKWLIGKRFADGKSTSGLRRASNGLTSGRHRVHIGPARWNFFKLQVVAKLLLTDLTYRQLIGRWEENADNWPTSVIDGFPTSDRRGCALRDLQTSKGTESIKNWKDFRNWPNQKNISQERKI